MAVSVGSPIIFWLPSSSLPTVAAHARQSFNKKSFCPAENPSVSAAGAPPYTHSLFTVILFIVSVPVLSEHMTDVEPSVSTACIWRTSAFFDAIFLAPLASMSVTISDSVSGTAATASVTATIIISMVSLPPLWMRLTTNSTMADITAIPLIILPTLSRRTCKVVFFCFVSVKKRAILPISVLMPVAVTTAAALPAVTRQPEYTQLALSPSGTSAENCAAASFSAGTLSPVKELSSTARLSERMRRASAGTMSPVLSMTISPGTSSSGSVSRTSPPRSTRHMGEESEESASSAFSALRS